ncbi:hypothetical protein GA0061094_0656 [[Bacillus] enclensis]|uniref:Uncharacterized protein n=1 Tax=[Bacillus] enclensis TaxID=1402860 RepID=A0A1C3ZFH9_9BACI|nr:hypothetical protein GA0061094_0656 [[Bacillus] enclensis]
MVYEKSYPSNDYKRVEKKALNKKLFQNSPFYMKFFTNHYGNISK